MKKDSELNKEETPSENITEVEELSATEMETPSMEPMGGEAIAMEGPDEENEYQEVIESFEKPTPEEEIDQDRLNEKLSLLPELITDLIDGQKKLKDEFSQKFKYDQHKESIIDRLHQELQIYKEDIYKKLVKSIAMDIILVYDDMTKMVSYYTSQENADMDPRKVIKQLDGFRSDLEEVLYRQGIEPYRKSDEAFDPTRQKVGKRIITNETGLHKTIAKSIKAGFEWDGDVLRPEIVAVNAYEDTTANTDKEEAR